MKRHVGGTEGTTGTTYFEHGDQVGTARVITNAAGAPCAALSTLPFGDGLNSSGACQSMDPLLYMGKERDTESNLDDFGARFYSSTFGRWMSPDWSDMPEPAPYADLTNPQSLNLYALARGNPETFADLDGHYPFWFPGAPWTIGDSPFGGEVSEDTNNAVMATPVGPGSSVAGLVAASDEKAQQAAALAAQVPPQVKAAIVSSVKASDKPSAAAHDKTGGFHEEGGIWGKDIKGDPVPVPALPGPAASPGTDNAAHIQVMNSADPSLKETLASIDGQWHVHPSGSNAAGYFRQGPSGVDTNGSILPINIVVGAGDRHVYFYDNTGLIGKSMTLKSFMTAGAQ
jgi:RHS repeat-associated protein